MNGLTSISAVFFAMPNPAFPAAENTGHTIRTITAKPLDPAIRGGFAVERFRIMFQTLESLAG
jgi:hypothetical protein